MSDSLKLVVDTLEDVPEAARDFYTEAEGGGFRLNAAGAVDKSKLDEFRETNITLKRELEKYEGLDPERYQQLLDAERERELKAAETAGEWEKAKAQIQEQHRAELAQRDETTAALTARLDKILRENRARSELEGSGAFVEMMLPHVMDRVRVVVGEDGERKAVATGLDGQDKSIADLVSEMSKAEQFAAGWKASGASGGGATGSGAGGTGTVRSKADLAGPKEKTAYIAEHGVEAFKALPLTN